MFNLIDAAYLVLVLGVIPLGGLGLAVAFAAGTIRRRGAAWVGAGFCVLATATSCFMALLYWNPYDPSQHEHLFVPPVLWAALALVVVVTRRRAAGAGSGTGARVVGSALSLVATGAYLVTLLAGSGA